jgi:hypothetical protein
MYVLYVPTRCTLIKTAHLYQ